jgi:hypothetical protein
MADSKLCKLEKSKKKRDILCVPVLKYLTDNREVYKKSIRQLKDAEKQRQLNLQQQHQTQLQLQQQRQAQQINTSKGGHVPKFQPNIAQQQFPMTSSHQLFGNEIPNQNIGANLNDSWLMKYRQTPSNQPVNAIATGSTPISSQGTPPRTVTPVYQSPRHNLQQNIPVQYNS